MNPTTIPPVPSRLGLAIASFVLGLMAFLFSLFVVGVLFGLIGLVLGCVHIRGKRGPNALAWWGVSLSVIGILTGIGMGIVYFRMAKDFYKSVAASINNGGQTSTKTEWEGVLAPDISVTTLDGKVIKLSELKGKRVVLDFWATWCGPCVKEIPHFVKLYNETSRDQLEIIGISAEQVGILKPFVNQKHINYPIASATSLPAPYTDPSSIPTTFFIDRKGVIQSVSVGYQEFDQLKFLALAEDFQGEPKTTPEPAAGGLKDRETLLTAVESWSNNVPGATAICSGDWDGDGRPDILVADAGKKLHVFGTDGVKKTTVSLPEQFAVIECGQDKQKGVRLLGYPRVGRKVSVINTTGKEIWHFSATFGADGAHWGDLDGDGSDEMIIGMNGFGGLQAVGSDGKPLWHASGGNIWGQAIVPASKDRPAIVFATEAAGSVRSFDGKGHPLRTLRPSGEYCTQLAAAVVDKSGTVQVLALGQNHVIAFDPNGRVAWSTPVGQNSASWVNATFASGDVDGDGTNEWAFVESAGTIVLASASGEKLVTVSGYSGGSGFLMVPDSTGRSELVTLTFGVLRAYRFR